MEFELLDGRRLVVPLHVIADIYEYICEYNGLRVDALKLYTTAGREFIVRHDDKMILWNLIEKLKTLKL